MNQFEYLSQAASYPALESAVADRDAAVGTQDKKEKSILIGKAVCVCHAELNLPLSYWAVYQDAA